LLAHVILAFAVLSATFLWGQERRATQSPLTREEIHRAVADELRKQGLREEQLPRIEDVELPAVLSAAADRTLRVASVRWAADRMRAQFRLECAAGQCNPFLVDVRMEQSALKSLAIEKTVSRRVRPRIAVRNGDRATVVFLGNRLHLTAAVICLEHGAEGDVIRVRNQDGHIFRARISGPGLLEVLPQ
jgi:hypothetical protein